MKQKRPKLPYRKDLAAKLAKGNKGNVKVQSQDNVKQEVEPNSKGYEKGIIRDAKGRLAKGTKGGPGRKKGSKDRFSRGMLDTWRDRSGELADKAIEAALKHGDMQALRLIVDRLVARADSQPIEWMWSTDMNSIEEIAIEQRNLLHGITDGRLTPGAAKLLAQQLTGFADTVRAAQQANVRARFELDQRLLAKAKADPRCLSAASAFVTRLHTLDLEPAAYDHPMIQAAVAVAKGGD